MGNKPLSVLDVGCGSGDFLTSLSDIDGFKKGIDLSPEMIESCNGSKALTNSEIEFCVGNIETFEDNKDFNVVTALSVLPYCDFQLAVRSVEKLCSSAGLFIFSGPNILFDLFTANKFTQTIIINELVDFDLISKENHPILLNELSF